MLARVAAPAAERDEAMSKRAADCCDCKHWREGLPPYDHKPRHGVFRSWPDGWFDACLRDHKPKFYKMRHEGDFAWGWKRRCGDFSAKGGEDG